MQEQDQFVLPTPPPELFKNIYGREETSLAELDYSHKVERIVGTTVYIEGAEFPKKGFPTPQAVWSANQAKKVFIEALSVFSTPQFIFAFLLTYNKTKFIDKLLNSYNQIAMKAISPFILKRIYIHPLANELGDIVLNFLLVIGISHQTAQDFSTVFTFMIDIDDQYRGRLEDLFSESSKQLLITSPRKEIQRLIKINNQRELRHVGRKFKLAGSLFATLLLLPKYKKAFISSISTATFKNLQYDQADRYWVLAKPDYNYMGLTLEQRKAILNQFKVPILYKVNRL